MAIAADRIPPLTYDAYLAEGEVNRRCEIIDGVRIDMPSPTPNHQDIQGNIYERLRAYQRRTGRGRTYQAPRDILIRRVPLRTRQPDVMYLTDEQIARHGDLSDPAPFPAPLLVVEIVSPQESGRILSEKLADYTAIGVAECWLVDPQAQTVEVLSPAPDTEQAIVMYRMGEELRSEALPDFTIPVADLFAL